MKKQIILKTVVAIFTLLILISTVSFASYENVTMEVVEEPVCRMDITDNAYFEKKLVEKDLNNKKVTLELKVVNDEQELKPTGELVLLIDNSLSMASGSINGETRSKVIRDAAKELISNLLEGNDQLKIAISSFSTSTVVEEEGTEKDAKVVSDLSNDASALSSAIDTMQDDGPRTDLDAGLTVASKQFSDSATSKYLVVLTDGIPNVALDDAKDYYGQTAIDKTIAKLKSVASSGVNLITMLTGIDNEEEIPAHDKTNKQFIEEVFGTEAAPTAGTFYYVQDEEAEKTITETIYNSLMPVSQSLTNIQVKDYFPKEIIDNFDFAYVDQPSHGEVTANVDTSDNSIIWTIPELKSGETATVRYTLTLKHDYDSAIVDKLLPTNEKVDLSYTDFNGKDATDSSDISPVLQLSEPPAILPKAGTTILIVGGTILIGFALISLTRYLKIRKDMK